MSKVYVVLGTFDYGGDTILSIWEDEKNAISEVERLECLERPIYDSYSYVQIEVNTNNKVGL